MVTRGHLGQAYSRTIRAKNNLSIKIIAARPKDRESPCIALEIYGKTALFTPEEFQFFLQESQFVLGKLDGDCMEDPL